MRQACPPGRGSRSRRCRRPGRGHVRRTVGAELQGPVDEGRPETGGPGAVQVMGVSGDHHHALRGKAQEVGGGLVDGGIGLVLPGQLGPTGRSPRAARRSWPCGEQGHVAIGQRRDDEPASQPLQACDCLRPRVEAVPHPVEMVLFLFGQAGEAEPVQESVEYLTVKDVDLRTRPLPQPHAAHGGLVSASPGVGELRPVRVDPLLGADPAALAGDRATPVDDGAEHVARQRLYGRKVHAASVATALSKGQPRAHAGREKAGKGPGGGIPKQLQV